LKTFSHFSLKSYFINTFCLLTEFIIPWDSFTGQVALFDCKGICITLALQRSQTKIDILNFEHRFQATLVVA
jgi:hypothetical protein